MARAGDGHDADMRKLADDKTGLIDLSGRTVIPD